MPARPGKPTRADVARRLGIHVSGVPKLEAAGELHPTKDDRGVNRFEPAEVEALAEKRGAPAMAQFEKARVQRQRAASEAAAEAEAERYAERIRQEQEKAWKASMDEWAAELAARARKREQR